MKTEDKNLEELNLPPRLEIIVRENGLPVSDVLIRVAHQNRSPFFYMKTGEKGQAAIEGDALVPGKYIAAIEYVPFGHTPYSSEKIFQIFDKQTTILTYTLDA